MCVIFGISDFDKVEDFKNNIKLAEERNKDGNSFSYFDKKLKKIRFFKAISNNDVLELIEKNDLKEFVYHARITSSGKTVDSLTHSFPLDLKLLNSNKMQGLTSAVYYMNGTLDFDDLSKIYLDYCLKNNKKIVNGELSDSKLIAILISIYGYNFINLFDSNLSARHTIHDKNGIHYFGNWKDHDNMKISNDYFIPTDNTLTKWESGYSYQGNQTTLKQNGFSLSNDYTDNFNDSYKTIDDFDDFEDYLTLEEQLIYDKLVLAGHSKKLIISWVNVGYTLKEVRDNLEAGIIDSIKDVFKKELN